VSDSDLGLWTEDPTETVIGEIMRERVRQVVAEHHLPRQDDRLDMGELARMAAAHAMRAVAACFPPENPNHGIAWHRAALLWPFVGALFDRKDQRRHLVIAAALIVAEIERLDRAAPAADAGA
jgi:hypothetical protein